MKNTYTMKQMMMVAAMAAMVFSSCAKEETVNDGTKAAIGIESYIAKTTKGAPVTSFGVGDKMSIWGYTSAAALGETFVGVTPIENMTPADASFDGTKWGYSPIAYWTPGAFHTFFAVSPATIPVVDGVADLAVNSDVAQQQDVMIADPIKQQSAYAANSAAPVTFKFRHALCQVRFLAKITTEAASFATDIKITKLTLIPVSGQFADGGKVSMIAKAAGNSDAYTVTAPTAATAQYEITPTSPVALSQAAVELKHEDAHVAMLLPQVVPAFKIKVDVSYTDVKNGNAAKTATFDVAAQSMTWNANQVYQYTMNISVPDQVLNLQSIEIGAPSIEDWATDASEAL